MTATGRALIAVAALLCLARASVHAQATGSDAARAAIVAGNRTWSAARLAYDRATFERMLTPGFYAQLPQRRASRAEFLDQISTRAAGAALKRFDMTVLTVQPGADGWVAVVDEKLEIERTQPDGRRQLRYARFITRDTWTRIGEDWQIASSEVLGMETWPEKPDLPGW